MFLLSVWLLRPQSKDAQVSWLVYIARQCRRLQLFVYISASPERTCLESTPLLLSDSQGYALCLRIGGGRMDGWTVDLCNFLILLKKESRWGNNDAASFRCVVGLLRNGESVSEELQVVSPLGNLVKNTWGSNKQTSWRTTALMFTLKNLHQSFIYIYEWLRNKQTMAMMVFPRLLIIPSNSAAV